MAKDFVYEKGVNSIGDFIYVDLLPQTRRGRQFNSNVILALLFALVLLFLLVFWPYRQLTNEFEALNDTNNDLQHELTLTQEEFEGYHIDLELVEYEQQINNLTTYRTDFNNLMDDVELQVTDSVIGGRITFIRYSAQSEKLTVTVVLTEKINFNILDSMFESLEWVSASNTTTTPQRIGDTVEWEQTFVLEVNQEDVE